MLFRSVSLFAILSTAAACGTDTPDTTTAVTDPTEVVEVGKQESGLRKDAVADVQLPEEEPDVDGTGVANKTVTMQAEFTYAADAAVFKFCEDQTTYNLLKNSGYLKLEKAYLEAEPAPFQPVLVTVTGFKAPHLTLDPENKRPTMVVLDVERVDKDARCR